MANQGSGIRDQKSGRFDAKAAFATLPPARQHAIGAAGLLLAYAIVAKEECTEEAFEAGRPFQIAESEAFEILLGSVRACDIPAFAAIPPALPDLNPFGTPQCRECGCTDRHGCPGGCSWVAEDLCSRCGTLADRAKLRRPKKGGALMADNTSEFPA